MDTVSSRTEKDVAKGGRLAREPEDARRGHIAPSPRDVAEAQADRELAAAERSVVEGTADRTVVDRLAGLQEARTHEERRRLWQESADSAE